MAQSFILKIIIGGKKPLEVVKKEIRTGIKK